MLEDVALRAREKHLHRGLTPLVFRPSLNGGVKPSDAPRSIAQQSASVGLFRVLAAFKKAPNLKNEVTSPIPEGSVRKFLHDLVDPGVFAPDAVGTLIAAFDGAWQSIIASGARLSGQQKELTRELLAKYIIEQARQGELDQCRLRDGALLHFARSNLRPPPREQK